MTGYLLSVLATLVPAADDPVFSGPQPGEPLPPLIVRGVFGDQADKDVDVSSTAGEKPLVIVFVHERTRPAFGLANAVMRLAEDRGPQKLTGALVYLSDDPTATAVWMNRIKPNFPQKVLVGISKDGQEGPGAFGLNRNVAVTVLVTQKQKVTANFALVQPSMQVDAPAIFKAVADVLGETEVANVEDYAYGGRRDSATMSNKSPNRSGDTNGPAPELRALLRPVIDKEASDKDVIEAAKKVEAYAAENSAARQQIGDIARRIIAAERLKMYGTEKSQEFIRKWAASYGNSPDSASPKRPTTEQ